MNWGGDVNLCTSANRGDGTAAAALAGLRAIHARRVRRPLLPAAACSLRRQRAASANSPLHGWPSPGLRRIGKMSCKLQVLSLNFLGVPGWESWELPICGLLCQPEGGPAVECGFCGKNGPKEMEFLQAVQGMRHTANRKSASGSCSACRRLRARDQKVTNSRGCLLLVRPGQAEGASLEGPAIRGFLGSLPEDGSRREFSYGPCSGGIPKHRVPTRGASTQPMNSSGDGSRFSRMAASFQDNWNEPGLTNQPSQDQSQGRSAASKRSRQPERRDISRG